MANHAPSHQDLEAIATRTVHDPKMRAAIDEIGVRYADHDDLVRRLQSLDPATTDRLIDMSEQIEMETGQTNYAYYTLSAFAKETWRKMMSEPETKAREALSQMPDAIAAARSANTERFEHYREKFGELSSQLSENIADSRNGFRAAIRAEMTARGIGYTTASRAPLMDHFTDAASVPDPVREMISAPAKLAEAQTQAALEREHAARLGHDQENVPAPSPSPSPSP